MAIASFTDLFLAQTGQNLLLQELLFNNFFFSKSSVYKNSINVLQFFILFSLLNVKFISFFNSFLISNIFKFSFFLLLFFILSFSKLLIFFIFFVKI
ncbi:Uncharacterised protein [Chlamydia trachomatis]|nr:Uncharacterised protein [Chlamydia trachomatis]